MKILVTGGHFSPALALIESLPKGTEVLIVGRKYSFEGDNAYSYEYTVSQKMGLPFKNIVTGRLQRKLTKTTLFSLAKMPIGIIQAIQITNSFKPDVVFTCGGYIALPIALASYIKNIPIVIHEQTQHAGLANKIISKFAHTICITFESSRKFFTGKNVVVTGNPLRKHIFESKKTILIPEGRKLIYVTGGSSGSHFINETVFALLPKLLEDYFIIHQTGRSTQFDDFSKANALRDQQSQKERYYVYDYIYPEQIGWILDHASLVITRSGINTVYELLALGKVALCIPLPHGQLNEQLENAKLMQKIGTGDYIIQDEATPEAVLQKIQDIFNNYISYQKHGPEAKKIATQDADKRIASIIQSIYEAKKESTKGKTS